MREREKIFLACLCAWWTAGGHSAEASTNATLHFYSSLRLKVYERGDGELPDRMVGTTPASAAHPVAVAPNAFWYVRPMDPLKGSSLERLAKEVRRFNIAGLDLSGHAELKDEDLRRLQALDNLQMLDLSQTDITDHGLALLKGIKSLKVLIVPEAITNAGFVGLAAFPHLNELNLDRSHVTDQGLHKAASWPALERLDISATRITDKGMADLARWPSLRRVILNSNITDAGAALLKTHHGLQELDISQTEISDAGIKSLAALPHLRTLYVGKHFGDQGARNLSASRSLETLDLTRSAITDEGVKALRRLRSLRALALSQTSVGNACVPALAWLPHLRMLELSETAVTSAGLAPLAASPHLEIISLSWTSLSREDLQGLAHIAHLQSIILNGVPLPPETLAQLRQVNKPSRPTLAPVAPPAPPPAPAPAAWVVAHHPRPMQTPPTPVPALKPTPTPALTPAAPPAPVLTRKNAPPSLAGKRVALGPVPELTPAPLTAGHIDPIAPRSTVIGGPELKRSRVGMGQPALVPSRAIAPDATQSGTHGSLQGPPEKSMDNLLKTIVLQSNPARGGAYSGLAGMKQVHSADSHGKLSDIISDPRQVKIKDEEDRPENSLGEINIQAGDGR